MSKMFVHYSGTLEAFKSVASQYDNQIVFIKGGNDGKGAAIYTHGKYYGDVKDAIAALEQSVGDMKYFTSIKAGDTTASAAGKNGVITFNAADPSTVSVDVNANGVNIGLSKTFTDIVAANTSGLAQEISRASGIEEGLRTDLGQKADTANADGSAFARIAQLKADLNAMTGGNGSISEQINTAINALDVAKSTGDYVSAIEQVDGKIVVTTGTFNFDEAGAADTVKSELLGSESDYAGAPTIHGVLNHTVSLEQQFDDTVGAIETLETENKTLVGAINEINTGVTNAAISLTSSTDKLTYTISQGGTEVGTINIPKDMVVESGEVVTNPEGQIEGTYIKLTLQNVTDPLYIDVAKLVDVYTASTVASNVMLAIDSNNVISASISANGVTARELADNAVTTSKIADANVTTAKIADSNVTKAKLASTVQASLDKADAAAPQATTYTKTEVNTAISNATTEITNAYKAYTFSQEEIESMHEYITEAYLGSISSSIADAFAWEEL